MKLSTLRMLLADSKYDDINLIVKIDPEDVSEGCCMCIFCNKQDMCVITKELVMDLEGEYYTNCQIPQEN